VRAAREVAVARYDLKTVCLPRQMALFEQVVARTQLSVAGAAAAPVA